MARIVKSILYADDVTLFWFLLALQKHWEELCEKIASFGNISNIKERIRLIQPPAWRSWRTAICSHSASFMVALWNRADHYIFML